MAEQNVTENKHILNIPDVIPILPLHKVLVFPKTMIPLEVTGNLTALVDEAMTKDRIIGLIMFKKEPDNPNQYTIDNLHEVGTCATIMKMVKITENHTQMLLQGISRFSIAELIEGTHYKQARIKLIEEKGIKDLETEALMSNLLSLFDQILRLLAFLFLREIRSDGQIHY